MKPFVTYLSALLLPIFACTCVRAQTLPSEMVYPDTLRAPDDSMSVYFSSLQNEGRISLNDLGSWGTDGQPGRRMEVRTTLDTLSVAPVNTFHDQHLLIPIVGRTDTFLYRLRFNGTPQPHPSDYQAAHRGATTFAIPEAFELANVILYLSALSDSTGNHPTGTAYTDAVAAHFAPFRRHALVRLLDKHAASDAAGFSLYYSFRDNSYGFTFDEWDRLTPVPYHLPVSIDYSSGLAPFTGMGFADLLYLVQDFALQSGFRQFYRDHAGEYAEQIERQQRLMPVRGMWDWLEREFPERMDHYAIVFSPLIGGSHSTQRFQENPFDQRYSFHESIMFVSGPDELLPSSYDSLTREALQSGIVFTEIDHNYVNPMTSEHYDAVRAAMGTLTDWNNRAGSGYYDSPGDTFNEYVTHALFCLYVRETYPAEVAELVIDRREQLMVRRDFPRFLDFNRAFLTQFVKENRSQPLSESYPAIIALLGAG
ncbi:hypothetical protein GGR28_000600 [Lewinella aquimaris]|uniref:DUF4932 domain-containing protein n=1 Tax=Neolewinella aquimaris TaxID=1835722 RepID=A0A840E889_9BACT|nr:DUF4932 domain-containing protein [Neolewinella aquimaris]MBB4077999.1 hypothetical protein [Neolewinella aquimaris]